MNPQRNYEGFVVFNVLNDYSIICITWLLFVTLYSFSLFIFTYYSDIDSDLRRILLDEYVDFIPAVDC